MELAKARDELRKARLDLDNETEARRMLQERIEEFQKHELEKVGQLR
jgi:hypothetical protein